MSGAPRILRTPEARLLPPEDDDPLSVALDPAHVVPRRIAYWAERDPSRPFLHQIDGRTVTYAEMVLEIRRWVTVLRAAGVERGERVRTMLPPSIDAHALWLASACMGAIGIPVDDVGGEVSGRVCFGRPEHVGVDVIAVERDGSFTANVEPAQLYSFPEPGDPASSVFSWAQLSATIGCIPRSWLSEADALYSFGERSALAMMCDAGGRIVLRERFSAKDFWADVRAYDCTVTMVEPSQLLGVPGHADDRRNPLRLCFVAGDPAAARRFGRRFEVRMVLAYGSTEMGFPIARRDLSSGEDRCVGWLRRGYEARIVDDAGHDQPDGTPGELWVRSPFVDGWYRSADQLLVHRADGSFAISR